MEVDREVLAAVFASRVALARKTEDQAAEDARADHKKTVAWVKSEAKKERSFLWFCDEFDLEPSAVRREIEKGPRC